ncbi:hypothetical protein DL96DRAFT_1587424 [Flagelloscypha sp. PMI_526]|nr:hypothetical protein DL96DRAFT_1587424 [Flagelloscypha sp. PMI_526]
MNTSQPYQPLSHALTPTTSSARSTYPTSASPYRVRPQQPQQQPQQQQQQQQQQDDRDDNLLDPQLARGPSHTPPVNSSTAPSRYEEHDPTEAIKRRGPGRPKGSKTKKKAEGQPTVSPTRLPEVTEENKPYFEFQWRILNLCSEFYGAAEELVRNAPPNVIAQSYQMGPTSRVDPLVLLAEAKRIVDTLMANPHQLIMNPPPTMNPGPRLPPTSTTSFMVPLSKTVVPVAASSHSTLHPSSFPTQYSFYSPTGGSSSSAAVAAAVASIQSSTSSSTAPSASNSAHAQGAKEGQWSDEEMETLKSLAEASRAKTSNGEIDWDYVVSGFGGHRTRHQVLIKGTLLGLKESSSKSGKGNSAKRKRDGEADPRPARSHPSPDRTISPQQQQHHHHQQHAQSTPTMYPMPVMAVSDRPSSAQDVGGSSYYRPRPTSGTTGDPPRPTAHTFMYPPLSQER